MLNDLGMKVVQCINTMFKTRECFMQWNNRAVTVPFEGKIGNEAKAQWKKYNKLKFDYKIYTKD